MPLNLRSKARLCPTLALLFAVSACASNTTTTAQASNAGASSGASTQPPSLDAESSQDASGPDAAPVSAEDHSNDASTAPVALDAAAESAASTPLGRERAAFSAALPVFMRRCGSCHARESGRRGALAHFDISVDPFGGHHRNEMTLTLRRVLGEVAGREATMPPRAPGSVQGEDLALIRQWLTARDQLDASRRSAP